MSKGVEENMGRSPEQKSAGGNAGQSRSAGLNREPLAHIAKRDEIPLWKAWVIRLAAVLLSLVVCAVVILSLIHI